MKKRQLRHVEVEVRFTRLRFGRVNRATDSADHPNGTCQPIAFTPITGNVCGTYVVPMQIKPGLHFVTCDVSFLSKVLIDAAI